MRTSKPISITLGNQQRSIDRRLESGAYESASEVVRAGLRALDREEEALNEMMRGKIREALDDPRPDIPADEVFSGLRVHHAAQVKADKRGA